MKDFQEKCRELLQGALAQLHDQAGAAFNSNLLVSEVPPRADLGDLAFPLFPFAKTLRLGPPVVAKKLEELLAGNTPGFRFAAMGGYVNAFFPQAQVAAQILETLKVSGDSYGCSHALDGQKIMLEFSSPNTNKPLHLGHLRNNTLGESVGRILRACGAQVRKVNLINDRGVHICKSMLAYQKFGQGATPESEGKKSDHFVGDYYVKYAQWAQDNPSAEDEAQKMLQAWEASDPQVLDLWKKMNTWAVEGIKATYQRTGIVFDQLYYESQTYKLGKAEILKGLEAGIFYKREDGAVVVDLPWKNSPDDEANAQKVLLRADGTSIYLTQDLGTAISRHGDWPFDGLIYVVANEQDYHFRVLFYVLGRMGMPWAEKLYHLSYGMVNLPEGRMKSREGTVVDADNLIDELRDGAIEKIRSEGREAEVDGLEATAEKVALGALHYYLLQVSPSKDMVFNPQDSLAFQGNTGPYLQYVGARITSMMAKYAQDPGTGTLKTELLNTPEEWELVKLLSRFPQTVESAGLGKDPSIVAGFLYDLAKAFSRFYHDHPVLGAQDPDLRQSRVALAAGVLQVLKKGFELLNIPFLGKM